VELEKVEEEMEETHKQEDRTKELEVDTKVLCVVHVLTYLSAVVGPLHVEL
jgi:hypothetical protein